MPPPEPTAEFASLGDADCAVLARSGNGRAMEELVRRYSPAVFRLARRLLRSTEAAEDAAQETFLRAVRAIDQFDAERSFRAWLFAIAWNVGRDQLRRRRRESRRGRDCEAQRELPAGGRSLLPSRSGERVDHRAAGPSEALEKKEEEAWLRRALDELRPAQRTLLSLREFEGLSYGELADLFRCRVGTIKSRINRARLELKNTLMRLQPELFN